MDADPFAEDPAHPPPASPGGPLLVDVEGYAGPLDLLLDLAKAQKVDLRHVSILELARQYLAFVERAQAADITLAADYLVMAAWLAYLKSRLLLPQVEAEGDEEGAEMAALLAFRLRQLEAMRAAARALAARPRAYPRAEPEGVRTHTRARFTASLGEVLAAYAGTARRRAEARYDPPALDLASLDEAMERLTRLLRGDAWTPLARLLPRRAEARGPLYARSALAAALSAGLEMTRQGRAEIRQAALFAPVHLRARGA